MTIASPSRSTRWTAAALAAACITLLASPGLSRAQSLEQKEIETRQGFVGVRIEKDAELAVPLCPGGNVHYTVRIENIGTLAGTGEILDPIPDGMTFVSGSQSNGAFYDAANDRIVWEGLLAPGADHVIGFSVTLAPGVANGTIVNRATGRMTSGETVAEIDVEVPVEVDCPPLAFDVDKTAHHAQPLACPGGNVFFEIRITHQTERGNTLDAELEDPIPAGTTFEGSLTGGAVYDPATDRITWQGTLGPGETRTVGFSVAVDDGVEPGDTIVNTTTATVSDPQVGDSLQRQATKAVTCPEPPLELDVEKTADSEEPLECPGGSVRIQTEIINMSLRSRPLEVELQDPVPEGTTFDEGSATGGAVYDPATDRVLWEDTLGSGDRRTVGYSVTVGDTVAPGGAITSEGTVTLTDPATQESIQETAAVTVTCPEEPGGGKDDVVELRVLSVEGVAEKKLPGDGQEWAPLEEGEVLPEGTEVATGFDGRARLGLFKDGELVDEIELEVLTAVTANRHLWEEETVEMELEIDFGEIKLDVKKETYKADSKISAPNIVTGIRGTVLSVATTGLLDQVTLFDSAIEVTLNDSGAVEEYEVPEGEDPLRATSDGTSVLDECRVGEPGCDPLHFPTTGEVERSSVSSGGEEGDGESSAPSVSADGSVLAFASLASDLTDDALAAPVNVFVRNRETGTTELVSRAADGSPADGVSGSPAVSAAGSAVAFASTATNLASGDTNGSQDVFVRDLGTGAVERVSVAAAGSEASGESSAPSVSSDGSVVAFASFAKNLVPGDGNGARDVFVRDREAGTTERVSVGPGGSEANGASGSPAVSADGRYVAFTSTASNLVPGDGNGVADVFVHDRETGETERVSVATGGGDPSGASDAPSISADGRYVAFTSTAADLVAEDANGMVPDVFVRDRGAGTTELVSRRTGGSPGGGASDLAAISPDGRYVAFVSEAGDLFPGDGNGAADVFLHDRATGETRLMSAASGAGVAGSSTRPALADRAGVVAFDSLASELVPGDGNAAGDVFAVPYQGTVEPGQEPPDVPEVPAPDPPPGPWLTSPELSGFEAKVRITPKGAAPVAGEAEPSCIVESLCVSGALPGRPEVFVKVIGPRPNGKLWTQISRFTPSEVEVWLGQVASGVVRYYRLAPVGAASDDVSGLQDREAFDPVGAPATLPRGALLPGAAVEPLPSASVLGPRLEPGEPQPPAGLDWLTTPELPGFRFKALVTPAGGEGVGGRAVELCIPETLCIQGALAGRPEVFAKLIGPRPNGFLWVQAARFTPSRVELWVEQEGSGTLRYYRLEPIGPGVDDVSGLQDREAFAP